jgi:hypothetical protein
MAAEVKVSNERAYGKGFAITPSDTVDFDVQTLAILATAAGNVVLVFEDSTTLTVPVDANTIYPFKVRRINATSTTATGLKGFW